MGSCCSSRPVRGKTEVKQAAQCPCCGTSGKPVERVTLMHQVVAPLNQQLSPDNFFFCASTSCNTLYFSDGGAVIEASQVRGEVGQKSTNPDRVICYCFDVSHSRVMEEIEQAGTCASKAFVVAMSELAVAGLYSR